MHIKINNKLLLVCINYYTHEHMKRERAQKILATVGTVELSTISIHTKCSMSLHAPLWLSVQYQQSHIF